ncbi:CAP domain-containing protein [Streptomyces sp. NPDC001315]|uniref:CAP domain-containing protein n=1 Tax=Streptomyces sp. NPDC001315 TaxID=3364562 RepID=UPI0036936DDA
MGRHRRSAAGRAATGRTTEVTETYGSHPGSRGVQGPQDSYGDTPTTMGIAPYLNPEAYAETNARSDAYLFAPDDDRGRIDDTVMFPAEGFTPDGGARDAGRRRRKKRTVTPVRTGLLGVSAAVALGTVAVASGVVPGLDTYKLGGGTSSGDNVQAADSPSNSATEQGGSSGTAAGRDDSTSTGRNSDRTTSPSASPSTASATPTPTRTPSKKPTATPGTPTTTPSKKPTATKAPKETSAPVTVSAAAQSEAEVLQLVNEERAKVGCSAVSANSSLTQLAEAFSEDMAQRNFFDHTDPDGATPWDRASKADITNLGGENIARGQADAAAVMDAWMNSPGHRANILNCDFTTLGVGVHFGEGGPWWTQDFGY